MKSNNNDNRAKGLAGENLAVGYLRDNGYEILERNYCFKANYQGGEIDIIAKRGETIHFVEVKSRDTNTYGSGREAVNYPKQRTIRNLATRYLVSKGLYEKTFVSLDVIEITCGKVEHLVNCF